MYIQGMCVYVHMKGLRTLPPRGAQDSAPGQSTEITSSTLMGWPRAEFMVRPQGPRGIVGGPLPVDEGSRTTGNIQWAIEMERTPGGRGPPDLGP